MQHAFSPPKQRNLSIKNPTAQRLVTTGTQTLHALLRGMQMVTDVVACTYGPMRGHVFNQIGDGMPECLMEAGVIAQRLIEFPDRRDNIGAMIVRDLIARIHETYGDGAATACIVAHALVRGSQRLIAAGANPVAVQHAISEGIEVAIAALHAQADTAPTQEMLAGIAMSVLPDRRIAAIVSEMIVTLGQDAAIVVEDRTYPYLDYAYINGGQWRARPASRTFIADVRNEVTLLDPLIMVCDEELTDITQIQLAMELALATPNTPPLVIIAPGISGTAEHALLTNHCAGRLTACAIIPVFDVEESLADIALLTDAEMQGSMRGRPPRLMEASFFGRARQLRISRDTLTIVGARSQTVALRQRVTQLRASLAAQPRQSDKWRQIRMRMARLNGGMGVITYGSLDEGERDRMREDIQKVVRVLESAMTHGVLPGGGTAFVACIPAVREAQHQRAHFDEAVGLGVVADALAAPFLQIVRNTRREHPQLALAEVQRRGVGVGYDAARGEYVEMAAAGILDSASVLAGALRAAASAAIMAIGTECLVLLPTSDERGRR